MATDKAYDAGTARVEVRGELSKSDVELCGREWLFRDAALDGDHGADEADGGQSGNRLYHARNDREFTEVFPLQWLYERSVQVEKYASMIHRQAIRVVG